MLQEFLPIEADGEATLTDQNKAQKEMSKLAKQMKHWPEQLKIHQFKKYETINMKTYKCRNKNNLSPINN